MLESLKSWARRLRNDCMVLYRASKDPDTPWFAKAFIVLVVAYALSPIDLIPDFIPILGYLDDLILIPLGIYIGMKLIPAEVLEKHRREQALSSEETQKIGAFGAKMVFVTWIFLLLLFIFLMSRFLIRE